MNDKVNALLQDSIEAANRSYEILVKEQKSQSNTTNNCLQSSSDVLSLLHWLHHEIVVDDDSDGNIERHNASANAKSVVDGGVVEDVDDNDKNDGSDDSDSGDDDDGDIMTTSAGVDCLQKPLMCHPENGLGRAALQRLAQSL